MDSNVIDYKKLIDLISDSTLEQPSGYQSTSPIPTRYLNEARIFHIPHAKRIKTD